MIETPPEVKCQGLDPFPFAPDIPALERRLAFHLQKSHIKKLLSEMLERALPLIRLRAVYRACRISGSSHDSVEIDGVRFDSVLLRINLARAERVFPFALTCGPEIDQLSSSQTSAAGGYCLETIINSALDAGVNHLQDHLTRQYGLDYLWLLSPGDFQAWPAAQRKPLLDLLSCVEEKIGLSLTSKYAFVPRASRAGIFYYTETEFEACQLCSREPCMGRRAVFNPILAQKQHLRVSSSCSRLVEAP